MAGGRGVAAGFCEGEALCSQTKMTGVWPAKGRLAGWSAASGRLVNGVGGLGFVFFKIGLGLGLGFGFFLCVFSECAKLPLHLNVLRRLIFIGKNIARISNLVPQLLLFYKFDFS